MRPRARYLDRLGAYEARTPARCRRKNQGRRSSTKGRRDEGTNESREDSGSFGRGGDAHRLGGRVWRRQRRNPRSGGSVGRGRQGLVQRQRRRSAGEQRKVLVQRSERWQGFLQRFGPRGPEVLKHARQVARIGATWRSHLSALGNRSP